MKIEIKQFPIMGSILTKKEISDIKKITRKQTIFFSDMLNKHYIFDFKYGDFWVSSINISNDLKLMDLEIFK
jgi:hypothetical protein